MLSGSLPATYLANNDMRLMLRMIRSGDAGRSAGFCFISTPQVRMNKNTLLIWSAICPIGADGVQSIYRSWSISSR